MIYSFPARIRVGDTRRIIQNDSQVGYRGNDFATGLELIHVGILTLNNIVGRLDVQQRSV